MLTNWLRSSCSYWLKQMMSKCARCVRVSCCSSVYNGYLPLVFVASPQSLRTEDCWLTRVHKDRELLAHYDTFGPGIVGLPQSVRTGHCWLTTVREDQTLLAHHSPWGPDIVGSPQSVRTGHCWLTTVREDQTLLAHHSPWGSDIVGSPQSVRTRHCWLTTVHEDRELLACLGQFARWSNYIDIILQYVPGYK